MSETSARNVKLLKCPSCGAPFKVRPSDAMVECEYCRSRMTISPMQHPSPASPTIIVETRHRRVHRRRLRRLLESAEFASNDAEISSRGGRC